MQEFIWKLVSIIVASNAAIIGLIQYLIDRHDKQKITPERLMLRALGSDKLEEKLKRWKHADVRTADEWENIEDLYAGYKALGGNGKIKKLYDECREIETTE